MGKFDFVQAKFPELAEYGNKAESFLNSDPETCGYHLSRVFESSIEIMCGLNNVSTKGSDGKDREKREIIDELENTGIIDSNIARTLTSMRRTRNKVAHNDNVTSSEISAFFQDSLSVCNWLMRNGRGSVKTSTRPQPSRTVRQTSTHDGLTIDEIEREYSKNSIVAEEKYEGKRITLNGRIGSVGKYYVLLEDGDVYCSFSQYDEYLLRELKSGQKFTVTGTFCRKGGSNYLNDCEVPPTPEERRRSELEWSEALRQAELNNQPKTNEKIFSFIKLILRIVWSYPFLVVVLAIGLHLRDPEHRNFFLHVMVALTMAFVVACILCKIFTPNEATYEDVEKFFNGSFFNIVFKILLIVISLFFII